MHIYDIISKKKHGEELTEDEIFFFADGYLNGNIPDYQASALLMAICLRGMTDKETSALTGAICSSGDTVNLSMFGELSVDKHSTGGVGDKTTMIVAPIVAAVGGKVAKMSGRGLGHTGGTIDKLESIPGYSVYLSAEDFKRQVDRVGISVIGQSENLAPLDKKLYALRDVTATVDSIPLIASSIMGKKLASGSHSIVLDVKCGSGSFMKTEEEARALAEKMVAIGYDRGRRVSALITNMDTPLGYAIGNILEVKEAVEVLSCAGANDITEVCLALATEMVHLCLGTGIEEAKKLCKDALLSGKALEKFKEWILAQGGDISYIDDLGRFDTSLCTHEIRAKKCGYICAMDTERIGLCAVGLGAGRESVDDLIDYTAGISLIKKTGDRIESGEVIALLHTNDPTRLDECEKTFLSALTIGADMPKISPTILQTIRK